MKGKGNMTVINVGTSDSDILALLEAMYQKYGYDFRQYSKAHIARRLSNRMALSGFRNINEMRYAAIDNEVFASQLLQDLSITVTEMFRDPDFYIAVREKVIPVLQTYSFIKIWHAGCATGEEVYSMAILLKEEGLYDKATIYATDFNQRALENAREGIISNQKMKEHSVNYQKASGKKSLSDYYTSHYGHSIMDKSLKKNIVWANHNLVTDSVFAEVHLILCRNVLIYFEKELQNRVHHLFSDSLTNGGILCLGSKESLRFTDLAHQYTEIDKRQKIYKKKYATPSLR
jgi:chemotaxis protein methyltransferase CheR